MNFPALPKAPMTPDGAELELISECIRMGGFIAFPLGALPNVMLQMAHERLVKAEQFRLIDISIVMNPATRKQEPGRIFKLTDAGMKRRTDLLAKAS